MNFFPMWNDTYWETAFIIILVYKVFQFSLLSLFIDTRIIDG